MDEIGLQVKTKELLLILPLQDYLCQIFSVLQLQGGPKRKYLMMEFILNTVEASPCMGDMLSKDFFLIWLVKSICGVKEIYYMLRVWCARQLISAVPLPCASIYDLFFSVNSCNHLLSFHYKLN